MDANIAELFHILNMDCFVLVWECEIVLSGGTILPLSTFLSEWHVVRLDFE